MIISDLVLAYKTVISIPFSGQVRRYHFKIQLVIISEYKVTSMLKKQPIAAAVYMDL